MSHVSDKPAAGVLDDLDLYTSIYRRMLLIRGFEELVHSLFLKGEVYGTTHLYSGQEAVATGIASLLEERDRVAATYRGHGHALALGGDPQTLLGRDETIVVIGRGARVELDAVHLFRKCEPLNGVMNVLYGEFGSKVNLVN